MEKYDGWVIRSQFRVPNFLMAHTFRPTRSECISSMYGSREWYDKERKRGNLKCVKVRVCEVFEE